MKRPYSLTFKMAASYMALALLLLAVAGVFFWKAVVDYAEKAQQERMEVQIEQIRHLVAHSVEAPDELQQRLRSLFPDFEIDMRAPVMIITRSPLPDAPLPEPMARTGMIRAVAPSGQSVPYFRDGEPVAEYFITANVPAHAISAYVYPRVAAMALVWLAVAGLFGWWSSRVLSRPLRRLADASASVSGREFPQSLHETGTVEVDAVILQFNRMVGRLERSFQALEAERDTARRFAADAAHELKSPVTALRVHHDLIRSKPNRAEQSFTAVERQLQKLERTIGGLLRIASLTEGAPALGETTDLPTLIRELAKEYAETVQTSGHEFVLDLPAAGIPARTDPGLLAIALGNLIDNACKYTPAPGRVTLRVRAWEHGAAIDVEDTGRGIAPSDIQHVFRRFHRGVDTQEIPGSGLGLSIVEAAVLRMGGRVEVQSEMGEGSRFTIILEG